MMMYDERVSGRWPLRIRRVSGRQVTRVGLRPLHGFIEQQITIVLLSSHVSVYDTTYSYRIRLPSRS